MSATDPVFDETLCANHPEQLAVATCVRCGNFMCINCERRTRPTAMAMCPDCWLARSRAVAPKSETSVAANVALGLSAAGILSSGFLPGLNGLSLIVNAIVWFTLGREPLRAERWKPGLGVLVSLFGALVAFAVHNR